MTLLLPGVCCKEIIHEKHILQGTEQMLKNRSYHDYVIII